MSLIRKGLALVSAVVLAIGAAAVLVDEPASAAAYSGIDLCAHAAIDVNFPISSRQVAVAVAMAESRCNPDATNNNSDGTIDRGLWQINSVHTQYTTQCLFDAECNARAAYDISAGGSNWQPWTTYKSGAYLAFMDEAQAALDRAGSGGGSGVPGLPMVAFAGRNEVLYLNSSAGLQNTGQGMQAGTSPSVTTLASGGHEIAFQANTHHVAVYGSGGNHVFSMAMMAGTSPAIARYGSGTNYLLAYQGAAGTLEYFNSTTGKTVNTGLGMRAGTSPSIATNGSNYQIAINSNVGILYAWTNGKAANLGYSIKVDTNPAVTAVTGGFEIAFQSAGGHLWVDGTLGTGDRGLALAAGSSPAIVNQGDSYVIAAPAADGTIQMVPRSGGWTRTEVAFRANTSPAVTHYDGSYEIAAQHKTGILVLAGKSGYKSTGQAMDLTTSPATG